jgi:hypothetical protein
MVIIRYTVTFVSACWSVVFVPSVVYFMVDFEFAVNLASLYLSISPSHTEYEFFQTERP